MRCSSALKAGEFYSSQGPRIHNVEVTRTEVRIECSPANASPSSPALRRR